MRPLLFVTGHVPAYRAGALAALHEREGIEVALFGGRSRHGGADAEGELPFPHLRASPAEIALLAARGDYRAVVCSTGGRLALPAAWAGARAGRRPVLLWASLWAHPRSAAHAFSYLPLRRLYRTADAVVTYGPHVSAYVRARGARNVHVAPQSVDNEFWRSREVHPPSDPRWPRVAGARVLFVGRAAPEKGLVPLLAAWSGVGAKDAALLLAGEGLAAALRGACPSRLPAGALPAHTRGPGTQAPPPLALGALTPVQLRDVYAACDVLVVPSVATATFREPWGLVVNEAMNRGLAVIASDAVGAAAGGLVRDGYNGLVVPAGDVASLSGAIELLCREPGLRARLGAAGREDVAAYTHEAWARGFSSALSSLGLSTAVSSREPARGRW
ncbi:MAG TPA: glycosyltransferase family 4 protein [Solirubrobacteraceae bacterium]|nr:glycosyltransferase family 4 protein [Solirubrobacteraceae bacterium]